jgi:hypothetical protein
MPFGDERWNPSHKSNAGRRGAFLFRARAPMTQFIGGFSVSSKVSIAAGGSSRKLAVLTPP